MRSSLVWALIFVFGVISGTGVLAQSPLDMTGTLGQPCFADGTCAYDGACNEAGLCENCGGPGQRTCDDGSCDFGWVPIGGGAGAYCGYLVNDVRFRQNCGSAGFLMCEGRDYCWGAAVALGNTRFCVACGELGERCCEGNACREPTEFAVCVAGRCVPPQAPASIQPAAPEPLPMEEGVEEQAAPGGDEIAPPPPNPVPNPVPGLDHIPEALRAYPGLYDCGCSSTDGRNGTCRSNGCSEPEHFSGTCIWTCKDPTGALVTIRGRDGVRLN